MNSVESNVRILVKDAIKAHSKSICGKEVLLATAFRSLTGLQTLINDKKCSCSYESICTSHSEG